MSQIFAELLTVARKLNNYLENATTSFDSTTSHKYVVPVGKRWSLIGGIVKRDVSSTLSVIAYDSSDNPILEMSLQGAATALVIWPDDARNMFGRCVLDAGEYVHMAFGTAQDTGAYMSCMAMEVDV